MTQMTQEQLLAMAAQWQQQAGFNSDKAVANAKPQTDYWAPKNGITVFRILPPGLPGNETYADGFDARRYYKYWIEIPNTSPNAQAKSQKWTIYDGKKSLPKRISTDPIGDVLQEAAATVPADILKNFRSKARCLCNVWISQIYDERGNLIDGDMCNKVVVADLPIGFFDYLKSARVSPMLTGFFNPYAGIELMLNRTGSGRNNTEYNYSPRPAVAPSPIVPDLDKLGKILADVQDLAKLVESNCNRDAASAAEVAAVLREHFNEMGRRNSFANPAQFNPQNGFQPGAMPGGFAPTLPGAGQQQWPQQPMSAPMGQQWPQQPQQPQQPWAPPMAPQMPQMPQMPQTQQSPSGWPNAPQAPQTAWPNSQPVTPPSAPVSDPAQAHIQTTVAPPQQSVTPPVPSKPACYKQFFVKNGTDPSALENPKDAQCKTCVFKMPCQFESAAS